MNETTLKPCPFCGEKAELVAEDCVIAYVRCMVCKARTSMVYITPKYNAEEMAIRRWNWRANNG